LNATTAPLERAIAIAAEAHAGQTDKGGAPYILHPLRVMLSLATQDERIAAVLHDVVEDSDWTFEALSAEGFGDAVVGALRCLTKQEGEPYEAFIARARANPIARRVKLADIADNSNLSRIPAPTAKDLARLEKYRKAAAALGA